MKEKILLQMRFSFENEKKARVALQALEPELLGKHETRAHTIANIKKNILAFSVSAGDLGAMKASMLSYAKSVALVNEII